MKMMCLMSQDMEAVRLALRPGARWLAWPQHSSIYCLGFSFPCFPCCWELFTFFARTLSKCSLNDFS